jgi:hypothetical protein
MHLATHSSLLLLLHVLLEAEASVALAWVALPLEEQQPPEALAVVALAFEPQVEPEALAVVALALDEQPLVALAVVALAFEPQVEPEALAAVTLLLEEQVEPEALAVVALALEAQHPSEALALVAFALEEQPLVALVSVAEAFFAEVQWSYLASASVRVIPSAINLATHSSLEQVLPSVAEALISLASELDEQVDPLAEALDAFDELHPGPA